MFSFKDSPFHTEEVFKKSKVFKKRDIQTLDGDVNDKGGRVSVKSLNKTFDDAVIEFGEIYRHGSSPERYSNVTAKLGGDKLEGRAIFFTFPGQPARCVNIEWEKHSKKHKKEPLRMLAVWEAGPNPPPPPPPGKCTVYKTVTSHTTVMRAVKLTAILKLHLGHIWPMLRLCSGYARAMLGLCLGYT